MRAVSIFLVIVLIAAANGLNAAPPVYTIYLRAHPPAIVADGKSETTVSAEVHDPSGKLVPDGTRVDFTSSIGTIERSTRTISGVARARLQSTTAIGTAMVSAVVENGNAVGQLRVDFLEQGTEMFSESFITISSKKYLGYDTVERVIDSAGGVTISSRGLTITAEEAQIDLKMNTIKAKCRMGGDNIVVRRGDKRMEASQLWYDFNSMNGILLAPASEGAKRMTFRGRDLYAKLATEDADQLKSLEYTPTADSSMFIKADTMVVRPGEEIKFKRAVFYMDGSRVVKVPLYVVNLRGAGGTAGQLLSMSSNGVKMDLPFYYSLTPNSTGAFRLRRNETGGWGYYSDRPSFQLDLQQDYNYGGSTDGSFLLNRITSWNDWGARWTHRTQFANDSQLYSYIDFPSHRSLFGSLNYSRTFSGYTMSVNTRASKLTGRSGTAATDAYIQTRAKSIFGGALSYTFNTRVSADTTMKNRFGSGVGLQLYTRPAKLGFLGNLNTSLQAGQSWGAYGGPSLMAVTGLSRQLGNAGSIGLDYAYTYANQGSEFDSQRLSLSLGLYPSEKWSCFLNATRGLDDGSISAFGNLSYSFAPTWRFDVLGTYQKFGDYSYPDFQFALGKAIGKQEFSIVWSTAIKRFHFEFSALKF